MLPNLHIYCYPQVHLRTRYCITFPDGTGTTTVNITVLSTVLLIINLYIDEIKQSMSRQKAESAEMKKELYVLCKNAGGLQNSLHPQVQKAYSTKSHHIWLNFRRLMYTYLILCSQWFHLHARMLVTMSLKCH